MFGKLHDCSIDAMHIERECGFGVQRYAADLAYVRKGKNIGDGVRVIPDVAKVRDISNEMRVLMAAVGSGSHDKSTGTDVVLQHMIWVPEDRNGGLGVQEYPGWIDSMASSVV